MAASVPPVLFRFDVFEVDLRSGELRKQDVRIKLHDQPFQLLAILLERPGELVTRQELRQRLWSPDTFVDFETGLNSAVKKLRDALGDSAESPRFIETLPRRGYRLIAKVEAAMDGSKDGTSKLLDPATENQGVSPLRGQDFEPRRRHRGRVIFFGLASAALFLTLLVALKKPGLGERGPGSPAAKPIQSLAVLPLENLSADPGQQYFADGMTEALITELGKIRGLRVISRTSVMHYKATRETLPQIARELNVDAIIEGAVFRSGGRARITIQLVQAQDERHLWAEQYERDLSDMLAMQDEVARDIAIQVRTQLSDGTNRLSRPRSISPEAQDAYLRGRYEWNKWTTEGLTKSVEYFQEATEKDPGYAEAWAGLSDAYAFLNLFGFSPSSMAVPRAKAAALKALELDPTLSQAHVSLSTAEMMSHTDGYLSVAEKELQRAIELNPSNVMAQQYDGYLLAATGRFDEGIAAMKRARNLDPLSPNTQNSLGAAYYLAGRYDEALEQFLAVPDPDLNSELRHRRIAAIYERKGMRKEAMAQWLTALWLAGKNDLAQSVQRTYLSSGYSAARKALLLGDLREIRKRAARPNQRSPEVWEAMDYSLLGEKNRALQSLDKAVQNNAPGIIYLKVDDVFESLRPDPRFSALLRRLGLLQ